MTAATVAFRHLFEALCAACVVVTVLAAADGSPWWALAFAGLAFAAHEASAP